MSQHYKRPQVLLFDVNETLLDLAPSERRIDDFLIDPGSAEAAPPSAAPIETRSVLTCPHCRRAEEIEMPTDSCLFFHDCGGCGALLRPLAGDCCVFCSYGSVKCPPRQAEGGSCCDVPRA